MKKNIFVDIKNKNDIPNKEYRADRELSKKIVDDIAANENFQAVMKALSDK